MFAKALSSPMKEVLRTACSGCDLSYMRFISVATKVYAVIVRCNCASPLKTPKWERHFASLETPSCGDWLQVDNGARYRTQNYCAAFILPIDMFSALYRD